MLPHKIVQILTFFDICGFNSGSSRLTINEQSKWIICFVHISSAIFFTLLKFCFIFTYYPSLGVIEAISEFLQYFVALCSYWMIIFDSIFKWDEHRKFWNIFQRIHKYHFQQNNFPIRNYMFKIIEYFSMTIFLIMMGLITSDFELFVVICIYMILIKLSQLRVFYYLFCVEILYHQLEIIKREIKNMNKRLIVLRSMASQSNLFESQQLKLICEYFQYVHEMAETMNQIFGWSQVAVILFCCYIFLTVFNNLWIKT